MIEIEIKIVMTICSQQLEPSFFFLFFFLLNFLLIYIYLRKTELTIFCISKVQKDSKSSRTRDLVQVQVSTC